MSRIFISYRREDSAAYAGRLADQLSLRFGHETFMDVESISAGEDFVRAIQEKLASCDVLLVVIGRAWLSATTADGHLRLNDATDIVSMEIAMALDRNLRVIPVLVGGAVMPTLEQLPKALAPLCRRNALEVSDARFHDDVKRLVAATEGSQPSTRHDRPKYKRSIQVLSGVQMAGAWVVYILSMAAEGRSGDDGPLMIWVLLWLTGAILIELSRRSNLRDGIFLGITVPLALIAEVALESPTSYTGALGYSHWEILGGLSLLSALLSSFLTYRVFNVLSGRSKVGAAFPMLVLIMVGLLWLVSRYF